MQGLLTIIAMFAIISSSNAFAGDWMSDITKNTNTKVFIQVRSAEEPTKENRKGSPSVWLILEEGYTPTDMQGCQKFGKAQKGNKNTTIISCIPN